MQIPRKVDFYEKLNNKIRELREKSGIRDKTVKKSGIWDKGQKYSGMWEMKPKKSGIWENGRVVNPTPLG